MADKVTKEIELSFSAKVDQASISSVKKSLESLSNIKTKDSAGNLNKELASVTTTAQSVQRAMKNAFNTDLGTTNLKKFKQEIDKTCNGMSGIYKSFSKAGVQGQNTFRDLTKSIVTTQTKVSKTNETLNKMASSLKNIVTWNIGSSLINSIQGSFSEALGYIKSLDSSLNNIRIVSGQSAEEMADFAKYANDAAKAMGATTTAYTDAALIFYQQGLGEKEVKERTDVVTQMANVTGDSVDTVSSYMTAIWNNFDDGSESLEHYADVITALGAATASSSAEISEGLEKFASVGETIGLSYDYATSALATVVANTRQSADTVGTAFKTIFSRLQGLSLGETQDDGTTLNKYSTALQKVGVEIKDSNGNLKDADTILGELAAKWKVLNKDQQVALAQTVAGTRQYTQLVALMDNWDDMETNLTTAQEAEGTLAQQQATYMESLSAHMQQLTASKEDLFDSLVDSDSFKTVLDLISDVIDRLTDFTDMIGGGGSALLALGAILTKVFSAQIANGIQGISNSLQAWKLNADQVSSSMQLLKDSANIENKDAITKKVDEKAGTMIKYSGLLDEDKMAEGKQLFGTMVDSENSLASLEKEQEEATKLAEKLLKVKIAKEELFAEDNGGYVEDTLNKFETALNTTETQLKNVQKEYKKLTGFIGTSNFNGEWAEENIRNRDTYEEIDSSINNIVTDLSRMGTISEEQKAGVDTLYESFKKLSIQVGTYTTEGKEVPAILADEFEASATEIQNTVRILAEDSQAQIESASATVTSRLNGDSQKIKERVEQAEKEVDNFNAKLESTSKIQGTTKIIGSLGQVAMAAQMAKGSIEELFDEDTSGLDKFLDVLVSASFTIPMVTTALTDLKALGIVPNIASIKESIAAFLAENEVKESSIAFTEEEIAAQMQKTAGYKAATAAILEHENALWAEVDAEEVALAADAAQGDIELDDLILKEKEIRATKESIQAKITDAEAQMTDMEVEEAANKVILEKIGLLSKEGGELTAQALQKELFAAASALEAEVTAAETAATEGAVSAEVQQEIELKKLTAAKLKDAAASLEEAAAQEAANAASKKSFKDKISDLWKGAKKLLSTLKSGVAELGSFLLTSPLGPIVLLAAITAGVYAYSKYITSADERAVKKAEESNKAVQESVQETQQAYEDLTSSINSYKDAADALSDLTVGTQEYNEKLQEVNQTVTDLLEKYPQLAKYITTGSSGELSISDTGIQELQKENVKNLANSQLASSTSTYNLNEAKQVDMYDDTADKINTTGDNYAGLVSDSGVEMALKALQESGTGVLSSEESWKEALRDVSDGLGLDPKEAEALRENSAALIDLMNSVNDNTEILKTENQAAVHTEFSGLNNENYNNSEYQSLIDKNVAKDISKGGDLYKEEYEEVSNYKKKDLEKAYKEAMGLDSDADVSDVSKDDMKDFLASSRALEKASQNIDKYVKEAEKSGKDASSRGKAAGLNDDFNSFLGGDGGNLSNSSKEDLDKYTAYYKSLSLDPTKAAEEAEAMGYNSANEYIDAIKKAIDARQEELNAPKEDSKTYFQGDDFKNTQTSVNSMIDNADIVSSGSIEDSSFQQLKSQAEELEAAMPQLGEEIDEALTPSDIGTEKWKESTKLIQDASNVASALASDDTITTDTIKDMGLSFEDIDNIIVQSGIDTEEYKNKIEELKAAVKQQEMDDLGIDQSTLDNEVEALKKEYEQKAKNTNLTKKQREEYKKLADGTEESTEELEKQVLAAKKVQKGYESLKKSGASAVKTLKSSTSTIEEQGEAYDTLQTSLKEMMGVDLDQSFIKDNLDDISALISGDASKLDTLRLKAAENFELDYVAELDDSESSKRIKEDFADLQKQAEKELPNIEAGASLDGTNFMNSLNTLVEACHGNVTMIQGYLDNLGIDYEWEEDTSRYVEAEVPDVQGDSSKGYSWSLGTKKVKLHPFKLVAKKGQGIQNTNTGTSSSSSGSSKSSSSDVKNSDDVAAIDYDKVIEPYHDLNKALEKINDTLQDIQRNSDNAFGTEKIENLIKQAKEYGKLIKTNKDLSTEASNQIKDNQKDMISNAKTLGISLSKKNFDSDGNLKNWQGVQSKVNSRANKASSNTKKMETASNVDLNEDKLEKKGSFYKVGTKVYTLYTGKNNKNKTDYYLYARNINNKVQRFLVPVKKKVNKSNASKLLVSGTENQKKRNSNGVIWVNAADPNYKKWKKQANAGTAYNEANESLDSNISTKQTADNEKEEAAKNLRATNLETFTTSFEMKFNTKEVISGWNDFTKTMSKDLTSVFKDGANAALDVLSDLNNVNLELSTFTENTKIKTTNSEGVTTTQTFKDSNEEAKWFLNQFNNFSTEGKENFDSKSAIYETMKTQYDNYKEALENAQSSYEDAISQLETFLSNFDEKFEMIYNALDKLNTLIDHEITLSDAINGSSNKTQIEKKNSLYQGKIQNDLQGKEAAIREYNAYAAMLNTELSKKGLDLKDLENKENINDRMKQAIEGMENAEEQLYNYAEDISTEASNIFANNIISAERSLIETLDGEKDSLSSTMSEWLTNWNNAIEKDNKYLNNELSSIKLTDFNLSNQKTEEKATIANAKELVALRKKETEYLKEKKNLTDYDYTMAQLRYNLLVKEQALNSANSSSNKNAMQRVRNSNGDWSYQYVADISKDSSAAEDYANAAAELYKTARTELQSQVKNWGQSISDFNNSVTSIENDTTLSSSERTEKINEESTNARINGEESAQKVLNSLYDTAASAIGDSLANYSTYGTESDVYKLIQKYKGTGLTAGMSDEDLKKWASKNGIDFNSFIEEIITATGDKGDLEDIKKILNNYTTDSNGNISGTNQKEYTLTSSANVKTVDGKQYVTLGDKIYRVKDGVVEKEAVTDENELAKIKADTSLGTAQQITKTITTDMYDYTAQAAEWNTDTKKSLDELSQRMTEGISNNLSKIEKNLSTLFDTEEDIEQYKKMVTEIGSISTKIDTMTGLLQNYYGRMIYIGMKSGNLTGNIDSIKYKSNDEKDEKTYTLSELIEKGADLSKYTQTTNATADDNGSGTLTNTLNNATDTTGIDISKETADTNGDGITDILSNVENDATSEIEKTIASLPGAEEDLKKAAAEVIAATNNSTGSTGNSKTITTTIPVVTVNGTKITSIHNGKTTVRNFDETESHNFKAEATGSIPLYSNKSDVGDTSKEAGALKKGDRIILFKKSMTDGDKRVKIRRSGDKTKTDYWINYPAQAGDLKKFDTGGYTGNWGTKDGKLAVLHEKEIVLNKTDTANMLEAINILRETLKANALGELNDLSSQINQMNKDASSSNTTSGPIDNSTVNITANFPNATNQDQIQKAILSLPAMAKQRTGKKR